MADMALDEEKFKSIARLPAREVLDGQLAGVVASPLTGLVRGLGSMIQGLALQLGQIAEKGLVTGEAPGPEAAGPVTAGDPPPPAVAKASSGEVPPTAPPADDAEEAPAEDEKAEQETSEADDNKEEE
jgi:large subunit ribosomal protein L10